ncbi:MAG: AraC family transcriptional regulator [Victivallaceae bacterium]|jgi:AraC-like DNA-binding protein
MSNAVMAKGDYYFGKGGFPVMVKHLGRSLDFQHPHDLTAALHRHDFSELVIIARGKGVHHIDGVDYPVTAGDVFLIQGNIEHYFVERNDMEHYNVMFSPARLALPESELRQIPGYQAIFHLEPAYRRSHRFTSHLQLDPAGLAAVEEIIRQMQAEIRDNASGANAAVFGHLVALIVFISRQYSAQAMSYKRKGLLRLGKLIGLLEKDYAKDWNLDKLARLSGMSKNNLLLVFKDATGQSPIDFLLNLRLRKAAEMLLNSDCNISETALNTGFHDSNYFTRQFKKKFGHSPRHYRAASREQLS